MKAVLIQIYRFSPEENNLRYMASEFAKRGLTMVLWTNLNQKPIGIDTIPLILSNEDEQLLEISLTSHKVNDEDISIWHKHHRKLQNTYSYDFSEYEPERLFRSADFVLEKLNPVLFLCWGGIEPCYAIPRQIARQKGIPTLIWEAGMLPGTVYLNAGGIAGESDWVEKETPKYNSQIIEETDRFLLNWSNKLMEGKKEFIKESKSKTLLVIGSQDFTNGVYQPDDTYPLTLPGYRDSIDLAIKISEIFPGQTIYRPHPRSRISKKQIEEMSKSHVLYSAEPSYIDDILRSDVVVGYGSKVDFAAMALGRPFVMAGLGLITGKECAYEALYQDDLLSALQSAIQGKNRENYFNNFRNFTAYLLQDGHYNWGTGGSCRLGIPDLVDITINNIASNRSTTIPFVELFSEKGKEICNVNHYKYELERRSISIDETIEEIKLFLLNQENNIHVILDFDHTLWLGNSTEQFLSSIRPRIWGILINRFAMFLWTNLSRYISLERDKFRVIVALYLSPWTLVLWRIYAREKVDIFWNKRLEDAIQSSSKLKISIITFGFKLIVYPLIKARYSKSLLNKDVSFYSSEIFSSVNIRRTGKASFLEKEIDDFSWEATLAISDSIDDRDLLNRAKKSILVKWPEPKHVLSPVYFPLRYTNKGKYPGRKAVLRLHVSEDLLIALLAYSTSLYDVILIFLLWISFNSIYEIGYYENDFFAATKEDAPTLNSEYLKFENYKIFPWAWVWSFVASVIAIFFFVDTSLIRFLAWFLALIFLRCLFFIYNRTIPSHRGNLYLLLQFFKNFSYSAVIAPSIVGTFLLGSQVMRHGTKYLIYRNSGNPHHFRKQEHRLVIYILFILGTLSVVGFRFFVGDLRFYAISAWVFYKFLQERYGFSFGCTLSGLKRYSRRVFKKTIKKMET